MKDISQILKSLGLVDSEIKTYLQALKHGPSTVLELAKHTALSRQASYTAIESLSKRGLMSSVLRGKKHYYAAESPSKLVAYGQRRQQELSEQLKDLEDAVPQLELEVAGEQPIVRIFEGKNGLKSVLEHVSGDDTFMEEVGDLKKIFTSLSMEDLEPFRKAFKHFKQKRYIYSGEAQTPSDNPHRYFMPKDFTGFNADIIIWPDKVMMFTFEGKMHSMIIESKAIAQTLHQLFDLATKDSTKILKRG